MIYYNWPPIYKPCWGVLKSSQLFIDTHCHLDFEVFDRNRSRILSACQQLGISHLVVPSTTAGAWDKTLETCAETKQLLPALGLHPYFLAQHLPGHIERLEQYSHQNKLAAIGEIGLDFFRPDLEPEKQQQLFVLQTQLAKKLDLPILIHARKSHDQILAVLRRVKPIGGIIHAFNGSLQQAKEYIKLSFKLGFGGAFTYPRAKKLRFLVANLPLSCMVLETDAPDMLPSFAATQPNSPENLVKIFDLLVTLREEDEELIKQQLYTNSVQVFPELGQ